MTARQMQASSPQTEPAALFRQDLFAGQTVLVSGAGSGIGRATAHLFGRLGARLALCGRTEEKLENTASVLRQSGTDVRCYPMTIRDPDAVTDLIERVWTDFGALHIQVNCAGGQFPQPCIDFSVKGWQAVIDTNLNGTWYMMQRAARLWRDRGLPGAIINVVTVVTRGMPGVAHTCAARAGVIYASKTASVEWAPLNIRINCVAPGIIATEGMQVYPPDVRAALPKSNPMKRFGTPHDVANAISYLASPAANFITGEVLTIDGGFQLWGSQWTIPEPPYFAT